MSKLKQNPRIAVIGLGYVGLPLAIALAKKYPLTGFDINTSRIQELHDGYDRTREVEEAELRSSSLHVTANEKELKDQDIFIITVPTPINSDNRPDLSPLEKASQTIGKALRKGAIVVYESTVYPGVTEDFCGPILEKISGLKAGKDFYLGYSPERINPGDKVHTIHKITKIVSAQTPKLCDYLADIYGSINDNNIFKAATIKTAEAAKVIENTQRDINIAFINEISGIFSQLGLSVHDVLEAASTKWNFLNFKPGLVGGHCIGVDPYYLADISQKMGHEPEVILAGRKINENMSLFLAQQIHQRLKGPSRILMLGLTFKEDIPDLRNTKVADLINELKKLGHTIDAHDPLADPQEAKEALNVDLHTTLEGMNSYDCVVGAVGHKGYLNFTLQNFQALLKPKAVVADIKNLWADKGLPTSYIYWRL